MRILFLIRSLELGGAETQLLTLAKGCRELGHEVLITTFYKGGRVWEAAMVDGIRCVDLGKTGRWDLLVPVRRLRAFARAFRPDVVYSFLQSANLLAAIASPLPGAGALVWGLRASNMVFSFYGWVAKAGLLAETVLWRRADLILCNSAAGADFYLRRGVGRGRMGVVPNGIDVERFLPDPAARSELRRGVGVAPGTKVIGVVGRLDPVKDHGSVLEACAELVRRGVDFRLWCIGEGSPDSISLLMKRAAGLGLESHVRWLGPRADMPAVYNALDLLVSGSLSEGFPNVVAEAAACGTPCVVTDVGDSALIVEDSRYVVPPAQPAQLAMAMLSALQDESGRSEVWRERVVRRFERRSVLLHTLTALADALRSSRTRHSRLASR